MQQIAAQHITSTLPRGQQILGSLHSQDMTARRYLWCYNLSKPTAGRAKAREHTKCEFSNPLFECLSVNMQHGLKLALRCVLAHVGARLIAAGVHSHSWSCRGRAGLPPPNAKMSSQLTALCKSHSFVLMSEMLIQWELLKFFVCRAVAFSCAGSQTRFVCFFPSSHRKIFDRFRHPPIFSYKSSKTFGKLTHNSA